MSDLAKEPAAGGGGLTKHVPCLSLCFPWKATERWHGSRGGDRVAEAAIASRAALSSACGSESLRLILPAAQESRADHGRNSGAPTACQALHGHLTRAFLPDDPSPPRGKGSTPTSQ